MANLATMCVLSIQIGRHWCITDTRSLEFSTLDSLSHQWERKENRERVDACLCVRLRETYRKKIKYLNNLVKKLRKVKQDKKKERQRKENIIK